VGILKKRPTKIEDFLQMDYEKMMRLLIETNLQDKDYKWAYSNYGFGLLGYAISCVAGKGFWDLMAGYLAQDLGMKNTIMGTKSPKILTGYNLRNQDVGNWSLGAEDYLNPCRKYRFLCREFTGVCEDEYR
jgi:CubicO group peptidase (beta-lactamase class C family)